MPDLSAPRQAEITGPPGGTSGVFGDRDAERPAPGRRTMIGGGLFGRPGGSSPLPPPVGRLRRKHP